MSSGSGQRTAARPFRGSTPTTAASQLASSCYCKHPVPARSAATCPGPPPMTAASSAQTMPTGPHDNLSPAAPKPGLAPTDCVQVRPVRPGHGADEQVFNPGPTGRPPGPGPAPRQRPGRPRPHHRGSPARTRMITKAPHGWSWITISRCCSASRVRCQARPLWDRHARRAVQPGP